MTSRPVVGAKVATGFGLPFFLFALAAVPAREPESSPPGGLSYVPDRALAAIALNDGAALVKSAGPAFDTFYGGMAAWLGVDRKHLGEAFLAGRVTAALLPAGNRGEPEVLFVFGRGRRAAEALFGDLAKTAAGRDAGTCSGAALTCYVLPAPVNLTFYGLQRGGDYLAATSKDLLVTALAARAAPGTASALADAGLRKAVARLGDGPGVILTCQAGLLGNGGGLATLPAGGATRLTWTARPEANGTVETLRIDWPGARSGWAAVPGEGPLPTGFADFLPKSLVTGLVARIDFAVLEASFPAEGSPLATGLVVLPWTRLAPALSGTVALGRSAKGVVMGVLGLKDQEAAGKVLREFGLQRGGIGEETLSGYTVYRFKEGDRQGFAWTLADGRLIFADSTEALAGLFVCMESPAADPAAEAGTSWKVWGEGAEVAAWLPAGIRPCLDRPGLTFEAVGGGDPSCIHLRLRTNTTPSALALLGCLSLPATAAAPTGKGAALALPPDVNWSGLSTQEKFNNLVELQKLGLDEQIAADVARLLQDESPAVAARAAYVLGLHKAKGYTPELCGALSKSSVPQVRRYAVFALMNVPDPRAERFLVQALGSKDAETVGLAATALERLPGHRAGLALGNALITNRNASDAVRTRLFTALAATGNPKVLGRVLLGATARDSVDLISAWVYCLQELTPKLPREREESLLVKLLDFPCIHLRRYATQRLSVMASPAAVAALERRASLEGRELAPEIRLAVAAIQGRDSTGAAIKGAVEQTAGKMLSLPERLSEYADQVREWPTWKKGLLVALPLVLGVALLLLRKLARRRTRRRTANQLAALVAPSQEHLVGLDRDPLAPAEVDQEVAEPALGEAEEAEFDMELEDEDLIPSAQEDEAFSLGDKRGE